MTVYEPRIVEIVDVNDTTHPNFSQVIYDLNHIVRDVEAHPDAMLFFEIQVPAPRIEKKKKKKAEQGHTGYLLTREARGITKVEQEDEFNDFFDPTNPPQFMTYAWSVVDLFNYKHQLKRGTYKVPIYEPPVILNLDVRDLPHLKRVEETMVWLRVTHPNYDEYSQMRCDPSQYHVYWVPEIHNFAPRVDMFIKPEKDPNYDCDGIYFFFHWADGFAPKRHMRLAVSLQQGNNIVPNKGGGLCFYATRGILPENKPRTALDQQKWDQADALTRLIMKDNVQVHEYYDYGEGKEWDQDFYKLLWDKDLEDNLYGVVQYLQRKDGVKATVNTVISRKLIEKEYDVIGYSVIQLNNPDGTLRYGTYTLDLYEPPIYVEELDESARTSMKTKITIGRPGTTLNP